MASSGKQRVVITGVGLVSPLGNNKQTFWEALSAGRSGVGPLEGVPTQFLPTHFGAEARDFTGAIGDFGELEKQIKRAISKNLKVMCREIAMGVASAQLAIADANLRVGEHDPERTGVIYGSDYIMTRPDEFAEGVQQCVDEQGEFDFTRWGEEGLPKVEPLWLLKYLPNMPASHIAIYNDFRGPNNSITVREASANLAVGEAFHTIRRGAADVIIAGATGTRVHPLRTIHMSLQEEIVCGDISPEKASRPFDKNRLGMVLGEGAGAIIMESLESAKARGATILAEVVGAGSSTVMDRDFVPRYDTALTNAMNAALRGADAKPSEVGHIHAHGLSTRRCDAEEAAAIQAVFGPPEKSPPVTSAKSYFGNLGAASGLVELIASVLALNEQKLFGLLNYETPDPQCPINAGQAGASPGDSFISANVTPQGQASAVYIRRCA